MFLQDGIFLLCLIKQDYMKKMLIPFLFFLYLSSKPIAYSNINRSSNKELMIKNHSEYRIAIDKVKIIFEKKGENAYQDWNNLPLISPIDPQFLLRISSDFGDRLHPIFHIPLRHKGIDFVSEQGTDIRSTGNGTIIKIVYSNKGYGNRIIIKHNDEYKTKYAHLDNINVKENQHVKKGEIIGTLGNTGLSTGPHLHYEIIKNNKPIDPMIFTYIKDKDRNIGKYYYHLIALEKN